MYLGQHKNCEDNFKQKVEIACYSRKNSELGVRKVGSSLDFLS